MKPILKMSTKGYAKRNFEYFGDLYEKFKESLKKTSEGYDMTKKQFILDINTYYREAIEDKGMSSIKALKYAVKRYDRSLAYRTQEERFETFTLKDFLQGASKEDIKRWRNLTRDVKGRFTKFDPTAVKYIGSQKDIENKNYVVQTYMDIIILTFSSPNERVFFSKNNIPAEYADYVH